MSFIKKKGRIGNEVQGLAREGIKDIINNYKVLRGDEKWLKQLNLKLNS